MRTIIVAVLLFLVVALFILKSEPYLERKMYSYTDLVRGKRVGTTAGGIPKMIIKTSWQKREDFPPQMMDALERTMMLNPDYKLYYFDDADVHAFMKSYSTEALDAYKKLKPGAFKADLFRYCILEKYGGCYSDIGHVMYASFDEICGSNEIVVVRDMNNTGLHNALICITPGHPFMKMVVSKCIENVQKNYYGYDPLCITGPTLFGKAMSTYLAGESDALCSIPDLSIERDVNSAMFQKYLSPGTKNKIQILDFKKIDEEIEQNGDNFILSPNGKILVRSKFKNYYNVMYKDKLYYGDYWNNGDVYESRKSFRKHSELPGPSQFWSFS